MPKQDSTKGKGRKARPADNSNEALAYHLSEAIRIVRERDDLPTSLYNDLADAISEFQNDLPFGGVYQESQPHLRLLLDTYIEQTKGGAR